MGLGMNQGTAFKWRCMCKEQDLHGCVIALAGNLSAEDCLINSLQIPKAYLEVSTYRYAPMPSAAAAKTSANSGPITVLAQGFLGPTICEY